MLISDEQHAHPFHQDNVRSKIILDGAPKEYCALTSTAFEEIVKEGGEQVSATVLGL